MTTSTLVKVGALAIAAVAAQTAWSAINRRNAAQAAAPGSLATNGAAGPADAYNAHAVQHDLSIGDAM